MADAFDAEISALAREINQQTTRIREAYSELSTMKHTTSSEDGMVSVTVGRHGQVRRIELNPRVYRTQSPSQLADAIMQQINKATAAVSEQSKQLLQPLLPEDLPHEEVFGQHATLDAFFPGPVEPSP
ncbi:YbaB/EbfC family nucleoid-associated protein [Nonomuraea sp. KC401]|uniref:YbaB/EbfC family nucleoid-associated protein n=1 Tax=unclassified Nonomuraea TaxID=2593643 RepID=UPI0010FEFBB5|nr:YbaB/EbfC family nucleoid-associated protein [Nonomuraea sp. KC401]NBE95071.1 YbaB/EbfC family DNA-binding protein [Nonomuraea sp. K271]TLF71718.1 YbaB/EbfC family nucleoid-associated protein [Nonomuraea sp. KC401]